MSCTCLHALVIEEHWYWQGLLGARSTSTSTASMAPIRLSLLVLASLVFSFSTGSRELAS